jgi:hypothetical protein
MAAASPAASSVPLIFLMSSMMTLSSLWWCKVPIRRSSHPTYKRRTFSVRSINRASLGGLTRWLWEMLNDVPLSFSMRDLTLSKLAGSSNRVDVHSSRHQGRSA